MHRRSQATAIRTRTRAARGRADTGGVASAAAAVVAWASAAAVAAPTAARADNWSLHAAGTASGGWTDNAAGQEVAEASFFTQVSPSGLFTFESPRTVHILSYRLDVNLFQTDLVPTTINHTGSYAGSFRTSPLSELALGASLGVGTVSAALAAADPAGQVDAQPDGATTFSSVSGNQAFQRQLGRDWRLVQTGSAARVDTRLEQGNDITETTATTLGLTLGADRSWQRTAAGLTLGVAYVDLLQPGDVDGAIDQQTQLNYTGTVSFRRDLGPRWATSAQVGVTVLTALSGAEFAAELAPVGSIALNYFQPLGVVTANFGVGVNAAVGPNLFVATTTRSRGVVANAGIPLPWVRDGARFPLQVSGSAGAAAFETVELGTDDAQSSWTTLTGDLAVLWSPREAWTVALRYQIVRQDGDEAMATQVVDFTRNQVLVTIGGRFPARQAAVAPNRQTLRVDGADRTPIGDEGQSAGQAAGQGAGQTSGPSRGGQR